MEQLREQRRLAGELLRKLASQRVDELLSQVAQVRGVPVLAAQVQAPDLDTLRSMSDHLRERLGSAVVALGAVLEDRPLLVVSLTPDLQARGLHAGKLAGAAAQRMGGGGGGRPNMAQAGGKDATQLPEALQEVARLVSDALA